MGKAIKKPVEIEFITFDEFCEIANKASISKPGTMAFRFKNHSVQMLSKNRFLIKTLEGYHNFTPEDVLIVGVKGEIYPCKIDIFEQTYNIVE